MRIIIILCRSTLARVASVWKPETGHGYLEIKHIKISHVCVRILIIVNKNIKLCCNLKQEVKVMFV